MGVIRREDEAERVSRRVGKDPGAVGRGPVRELGSAQNEQILLRRVQVVDAEMQVKLHRRGRIGP